MSRLLRAALAFAGMILVAAVVLLALWRLTAPGPAAPPPRAEPELVEDSTPPSVPRPAPPGPVRALEPLRQAPMPDYPLARVRPPERLSVQPYYVDNRLVLRGIRARSLGAGMQISGEVLADFDCDKAPAGLGLAPGPVMGLRIDVQLFDLTPVLTRGKDGRVADVRVDHRSPGRPVEGQSAQCTTETSINSGGPEFALARFKLPALDRPLAPGVYNLVASLTFLSQSHTQLQQIKWCSDFWGAVDEGPDPILLQRRVYPIIGDKIRHDQFYREVLEIQRRVEASARIYMSDALARKKPEPNCVIWGQLADRIKEVELLKGHPEKADQDFAAFMRNDQLQAIRLKMMRQVNPSAQLADVFNEQAELTAILKQNALNNLRLLGGEATELEVRFLSSVTAGRDRMLDQIMRFQDYMVGRYWVLLDGLISYGWNSVNRPGGAMLFAVKDNDLARDESARLEQLQKHDESVDAYIARLRETNFKYQPPETTQAAEDYLRRWPWTRQMLAENFTQRREGRVAFDASKWDAYRAPLLRKFTAQTDEIFAEIDTSGAYANRMWPDTVAAARAARDDVICLVYAYEFQVRTTLGEPPNGVAPGEWQQRREAAVVTDWAAIALADPARDLQRIIPGATCRTMAVYLRYRTRVLEARSALKLHEFAARYKAELQAGRIPPGATKH